MTGACLELYRRFGALLLLFAAAASFALARDRVIRLHAVDMGDEYRSVYRPVRVLTASSAMRSAARSFKRPVPIPEFIDAFTEGRVETVGGSGWGDLFDGVFATPGSSPLVDRMGRDQHRPFYFFPPEEAPFPELFDRMTRADQSFRLLKLPSPSGPRFAGMTVQGPDDADGSGAPSWIVRPFRRYAAAPLLLALVVYSVFPPRRRAPAGALVYPKWSSWILPDLVGSISSCVFFGLPFFLVPAIFGGGDVLNVSDGWIVVTLILWLMAAILASILYFSARYASFSLELLPGAMMLRVLGGERMIPYAAIESAGIADYRAPRWLRTLLFIASLGSWRMLGQALLVSSRSDWGIELGIRGEAPVRFLCSNLPGADRILEALKRERVAVSPELESAFAP